jgi:hypothetical protein
MFLLRYIGLLRPFGAHTFVTKHTYI